MFSCVLNRRLVFVAGVIAVLVFGGGLVSGGVIRVPGDVGTIQGAIDLAVDGDEIVVDAGVYREAIDLLGKAVFLHSASGRDVTVIDGTGLDSSVVTMVNGEGLDTVVEGFTITGGAGTVIFSSSFGGGMYLVGSGPTISDCLIDGNVISENGNGGGIYNDGGSPHVLNCEFRNNITETNGSNGNGAGMYNTNGGFPIIEDCVFIDNHASYNSANGGGLYFDEGSAGIISRCSFIDNSAASGGGIYDTGSGSTITDCLFVGNVTSYGSGGGIMAGTGLTGKYHAIIEGCTFQENRARSGGGGMYLGGSGETISEVIVKNCTFRQNSAVNSRGGGVFVDHRFNSSNRTIANFSDCVFVDNHAVRGGGGCYLNQSDSEFIRCDFIGNITSGDEGGGCYLLQAISEFVQCQFLGNSAGNDGGGIFDLLSKEVSIRESIFESNSAGQNGGGIFVDSSSTFSNLVVRNNHADGDGGGIYILRGNDLSNLLCVNNSAVGDGGGLFIGFTNSITLSNSTVADNISTTGHGDGIYNGIFNGGLMLRNSIVRNGSDGIWQSFSDHFAATYDNIEGGFAGDGNIDADPMFVNRVRGDYRLRSGSPCIDAGANAFVLFDNDNDLDGNARRIDDPFITDTGQGKSPVVDMGAYEFQAKVEPTLVVSPDPLRAGEKVVFTLLNSRSESEVFLLYSLRGPGRVFVPGLNVTVDLDHPLRVRGSQFTDEKGRARYVTQITENAKGIDIWFQVVEENVKTGVVMRRVE